jgi:hypothetical protein
VSRGAAERRDDGECNYTRELIHQFLTMKPGTGPPGL